MTTVPCRRLLVSTLVACCAAAIPYGAAAEDRLLQEAVDFAGAMAFLGAGAPGMVIAAVRKGETAFAGFGEIRDGTGTQPTADTLMRIGSISKAVCGDVMGSMVVDGTIGIADPLAKHLGAGWTVPKRDGRTLRLIDLVTQSSGLPRELPNQEGGTPDDPFAGNTVERSRAELAKADPYLFAPGTGVLYSNWGFDLLGLALAHAGGKPYADLLARRVLEPRGMTDTKFNLDAADEARTMQGHFFDGSPMRLVPTPVTIQCAGGLYTTAKDMLKWMAWHLDKGPADDAWRSVDHAGWLWRDGHSPVSGVDTEGRMAAMTLGWVAVMPEGGKPMILHKSGGLQGQFSFVAIAPGRDIGVFASINQFSVSGFDAMAKAVIKLIAELGG
ncbi:MAG: D-alanyl-D-alanine-carboxypeptidase/endopeptidase AmpH [Proteobacteria bacterium]|nr:D-alanyl-D-alanine-carboxypeptidase/endopeptidase AmpH [Pseudomonadota bacterium]